MKAEYITALETRLRWLKWSESPTGIEAARQLGFLPVLPMYRRTLLSGDTFCMNSVFLDMVEHARLEVPDTLRWDARWPQARDGWLWLSTPFATPPIEPVPGRRPVGLLVSAIGWHTITEPRMLRSSLTGEASSIAPAGSVQFCCFNNFSEEWVEHAKWDVNPEFFPTNGFGAWSYFVLQDGEVLGDRIRLFEEKQSSGMYVTTEIAMNGMHPRVTQPRHEIRWIYTAFHLMAQRLATVVSEPVDRATRRRAERQGEKPPPLIRIITLRRLEADRQRDGQGGNVDWRWQWTVRGHWRNQYYPSEGVHRDKFIEAYVKGPEDKPMKPDTIKLFSAER